MLDFWNSLRALVHDHSLHTHTNQRPQAQSSHDSIRTQLSENNRAVESICSEEEQSKIARIVEVCNVSVDEATRVLTACCMDETRTIDRILSGGEDASKWSEVSKKKSRNSTTRVSSTPRYNRGSLRNGRDVQRRVRDRDRLPERTYRRSTFSTAGSRNSSIVPGRNENVEQFRNELPTASQTDLRISVSNHSSALPENDDSRVSVLDGASAKDSETEETCSSSLSDTNSHLQANSEVISVRPLQSTTQQQSPNLKVNYAAAVATGTCHGKFLVAPASSSSAENVCNPPDKSKLPQSNESDAPEDHLSSKRSSLSAPEDNEIGTFADSKPCSTAQMSASQGVQSQAHTPSQPSDDWPSRDSAADGRNSSGLENNSKAGNHKSSRKNSGKSLILQFGSLGLTSCKSLRWTEADVDLKAEDDTTVKRSSPNSTPPTPVVHSQLAPHPGANVLSQALPAVVQPTSGDAASSNDLKQIGKADHPPRSSSAEVSASTTNNLQAQIPVTVTASFPQQSFPPSFVAPPHVTYGTSMNSFDGTSDPNRIRNPAAPSCVPTYDQTSIGVPSVGISGKQSLLSAPNTISNQSAGAVSSSSDDLLKHGTVDNDKLGTHMNGALPTVDTLNPPYLVTSYPYMMPGYPSMQYAPPALPPPGPSHYPFAALGQVSSQSAYPTYHAQPNNITKLASNGATGRVFGYDEGTQLVTGVLRSGSSLNDGAVYQSGFVNNPATEALKQKGISEAPVLTNRGTTVSSVNSVGIALNNGMVPPISGPHQAVSCSENVNALGGYDYNLNSHSHSSITNANPIGGWGSRANTLARSDVSSNNHSINGGVHHSSTLNSAVYPAAAPGYWTGHSYY